MTVFFITGQDMAEFLLAIDQGTTSTRAMLFDRQGTPQGAHQLKIKQYFPQSGWVEHDPEEIFEMVIACCKGALLAAAASTQDIIAIGIANQRETTVIWDRQTGKPLHRAIVWQDARTASFCKSVPAAMAEKIKVKTGLLINPYFSATKLKWLLEHVANAQDLIDQNRLAFGTMDSYLLWRLTDGKVHATDATNASRTLLFNIHEQCWDEELLQFFNIPKSILPTVKDTSAHYGEMSAKYLGSSIPVTALVGDQQAATVGQACFQPGMLKSTYGTGCFALLNTGDVALKSQNQLLTTVLYRLQNKVTYAIEGTIFVAGSAISWLKDSLHFIDKASETEAIANSLQDTAGVYMVPAFSGLGAPYWDSHARGAILGLTYDTSIQHIVRAALESVCYRTKDLINAMIEDGAYAPKTMRVDGGMVKNNWLLQLLADLMGCQVERPNCIETTALGAAYLAGLGAGVYQSLDEIAQLWQAEAQFIQKRKKETVTAMYEGWLDAIKRVRTTS